MAMNRRLFFSNKNLFKRIISFVTAGFIAFSPTINVSAADMHVTSFYIQGGGGGGGGLSPKNQPGGGGGGGYVEYVSGTGTIMQFGSGGAGGDVTAGNGGIGGGGGGNDNTGINGGSGGSAGSFSGGSLGLPGMGALGASSLIPGAITSVGDDGSDGTICNGGSGGSAEYNDGSGFLTLTGGLKVYGGNGGDISFNTDTGDGGNGGSASLIVGTLFANGTQTLEFKAGTDGTGGGAVSGGTGGSVTAQIGTLKVKGNVDLSLNGVNFALGQVNFNKLESDGGSLTVNAGMNMDGKTIELLSPFTGDLTVLSAPSLTGTISVATPANYEVMWKAMNGSSVIAQTTSGTLTLNGATSVVCTSTPVTGVTLNKNSTSLYTNISPYSETLIATVFPSNASNKSVTWSSSNYAVATVDTNGLVTAVSNGLAIITVTTVDGGHTASCNVTVSTYNSGANDANIAGTGYYDNNPIFNNIYRFLSGADGTWFKGSRNGYSWKIDANHGEFIGMRFDNSVVLTDKYTSAEGSTIVRLSPEYLDTMSQSKHMVRFLFKYGYAETSLTISTERDESIYDYSGAYCPFVDVNENDWYYDAVMAAYQNGLFAGTTPTTFSPDDPMTRGMFSAVLARFDGVDLTGYNVSPFTDVDINEYYGRPIAWAAENLIISGVGGGRFAPDENITREQMAVILANYIKFKGMDLPQNGTIQSFDDSSQFSPWAIEAIDYIRRLGFLNGYGNNFYPQNPASRAEVAQMFLQLMIAANK